MCGLKNPDMKKLFACDYHILCYKCIGQFPLGGKGAALAFPPSHFPPSHTLCHILSDCVHAPPVRPQSRSRCARTTGSPAFRRLAASCPRRSLPVAPPPRPSRWPAKHAHSAQACSSSDYDGFLPQGRDENAMRQRV
jgi:hypothetical protein